jgi:hypothetical protein
MQAKFTFSLHDEIEAIEKRHNLSYNIMPSSKIDNHDHELEK